MCSVQGSQCKGKQNIQRMEQDALLLNLLCQHMRWKHNNAIESWSKQWSLAGNERARPLFKTTELNLNLCFNNVAVGWNSQVGFTSKISEPNVHWALKLTVLNDTEILLKVYQKFFPLVCLSRFFSSNVRPGFLLKVELICHIKRFGLHRKYIPKW